MGYKLFDQNGENITHHDLQDKGIWCKSGASKEEVFVETFGERLNLIINPEKRNNPYAPDLLNISTGLRADLKTQNTPFFRLNQGLGTILNTLWCSMVKTEKITKINTLK
ncbi:MAG: hypothetical protein ACOC4B_00035 [Bacteroidota bacterium]